MKTTSQGLHLIIYIAILFLLPACENEIPYNDAHREPQLIMNALLDAGAGENFAYLHLSEGNEIGKVDNATLSLYVNGKLSETPEPLSAQEVIDHQQNSSTDTTEEPILQDIKHKVFRLTTALNPGDKVRLEATAEAGKYHVSAEVIIPQPVDEIQVDTLPAYLRIYNTLYPYRQYKITMKDRSNEKNYYRLEIVNAFSYRCQHINTTYPDRTIQMRYTDMINREDVILTDGHPATSDDEENEFFPIIKNKYNAFTDNRFSNSTATLKVYTQLYEKFYPDDVFQQIYRTGTITIRLFSITEATYRYLKALNCLESDDYDNTLMEPISLPCNVKGGLGFVGAYASRDKAILFPETAIYPPIYTK